MPEDGVDPMATVGGAPASPDSASWSGSNDVDATLVGDATLGTAGGAARGPVPLRRGDTVSRYVVLEEAGRGAMGVVYVAVDPELERRVAVKILWRSDERLLSEARALARVSHPNVVGVYDVGEAQGRLFVAMEYVDGTSADRWVEAQPRGWESIVDAYIEAGRGLVAAHGADLIHRDFKPANVMIARDGGVKVTDFGLARASGPPEPLASVVPPSQLSGPQGITATRGLVGTPAYMAPELHAGAEAGAASDQFAFCVSLWQSLYGEFPFEGDDAISLMASVVSGEHREPPAGVAVPPALLRVLQRGLRTAAGDRWPSMAALVEQLVRIRRPSRRAWWLLGGAALLAGAIWLMLRPAPADPCAGVEAQVEAVWSPAQAEALIESFDASELPYAPRARDEAVTQLDAYAAQWGALAIEACGDRMSRDVSVANRGTLTEHCLERARNDLQAVVEVLTKAEARGVTHAVELVHQLPLLSACTDPALASALSIPDDPQVRAEVARVRAQLAQIRIRGVVARSDRREPLAELAEQAERLGFAPLRAEVEIRRANAWLAYDHQEGARLLEQALQFAIEGDADMVTARAVAALLGLDGDVRDEFRRAEAWEQMARGFLRRWPDRRRLRVELLDPLARSLVAQGRFDEAVAYAREAAELAEGSEDRWWESMHRGNYGLVLTRVGRHRDAVEVLAPQVEQAVALLGAGHPQAAWSSNALCVAYRYLGEYQPALEACQDAVEAYRDLTQLPVERAQALNNLATVHDHRGELDDARMYMLEAIECMKELGEGDHTITVTMLNNLGSNANQRKDYRDAEKYLREAMQMGERLGHTPLQQLLPVANLAEVYLHLGDAAAARQHLKQTQVLLRDEVPEGYPLTGQVQLLVGSTYQDLGDAKAAVEPLEAAERILRSQLGADAELTRTAAERLARAREDGAGRGYTPPHP